MGLTNASSGLYNVSLSSSNGSLLFNDLQLSGFSSFLTYTTLFYAYGLNDSMTYTLTITNAEDSMLAVDGLNITVLSGGKRYECVLLKFIFSYTFAFSIAIAALRFPFGLFTLHRLHSFSLICLICDFTMIGAHGIFDGKSTAKASPWLCVRAPSLVRRPLMQKTYPLRA